MKSVYIHTYSKELKEKAHGVWNKKKPFEKRQQTESTEVDRMGNYKNNNMTSMV